MRRMDAFAAQMSVDEVGDSHSASLKQSSSDGAPLSAADEAEDTAREMHNAYTESYAIAQHGDNCIRKI